MESKLTHSPLSDLADFTYGTMPKKTLLVEGDYRTFSGYKYQHSYPEFNCEKGDVIVVARGVGGTGDVKIVRERCYLTNLSIKITLDQSQIDNRYFFYRYLNVGMRHLDSGSAQSQITINDLKRECISYPSLPQQKAIAHILGTLDDKIELNRRMNETLESMAQALFQSWFVDFDPVIDNALAAGNPIPDPLSARAETRRALEGKRKPLPEPIQRLFPDRFVFDEGMGWIPEGWEPSNFGNVSSCFDRKRIPLSKQERDAKKPGIIPYYGATSVMDYVNEWIFDDVFLLIGEDGSVIKEDGTPFVQYIWGKTWVNNHAHVLQGKCGISTEHLMQFMAMQRMTAYVTGAVQLKINQKNMNSIPFLLASDQINSEFAILLDAIYAQYRRMCDEQTLLTKLRDTLLPKLLSGELRIPDAEKLVANSL